MFVFDKLFLNNISETPEQIKEFLEREEFLKQLKECDIRGLSSDLLRKGVIDKDEADDIGFKKGAEEAASNLYMILQRDKSTNKLLALKQCLYANATKETHKDLADMISEFLGIPDRTATVTSESNNLLQSNHIHQRSLFLHFMLAWLTCM